MPPSKVAKATSKANSKIDNNSPLQSRLTEKHKAKYIKRLEKECKMSNKDKSTYICEKLIEISTRNCNNDKKLFDIPNQMFTLESSIIESLNTMATRDLACMKSLEMLNTCCKHNITIMQK
mgnify:CR=1 FL=1